MLSTNFAKIAMRCLPLADDCGISRPVTETIFRCLDAQSLRGTSVLAGGAYAAEAAQALGKRLYHTPQLAVGVHLNLLEGRALSSPAGLPLLTDARGWFRHSLPSLWGALRLAAPAGHRAFTQQMLQECRAQIHSVQAAVQAGWNEARRTDATPVQQQTSCPLLYLDGHLHIHALPAFRPVLHALTEEFAFSHVRAPAELACAMPASAGLKAVGALRRSLLGLWGKDLRAWLDQRGIRHPDYFIGAFASGSMSLPMLKAALERVRAEQPLGKALVEIMLHPCPLPAKPKAVKAQPQSTIKRCVARRQARLASAYTTPARYRETQMLLSPAFHQLMAQHDPSWQEQHSA